LAVIAEIALFAVSTRFPQRIGSLGLLGAGAFGAVLRWGVMSFNPPLMLLPITPAVSQRSPRCAGPRRG
jgi:PPP family 3-phenylpropionic acid transporter